MSNDILEMVSFVTENMMRAMHSSGIEHPIVIVIAQTPDSPDEFNVCANCMTKETKKHLINAINKYPTNPCTFEEKTVKDYDAIVATLMKGVKVK
jgi:ABC-type phosphate/phosphonate transport system substrate-binding protein